MLPPYRLGLRPSSPFLSPLTPAATLPSPQPPLLPKTNLFQPLPSPTPPSHVHHRHQSKDNLIVQSTFLPGFCRFGNISYYEYLSPPPRPRSSIITIHATDTTTSTYLIKYAFPLHIGLKTLIVQRSAVTSPYGI